MVAEGPALNRADWRLRSSTSATTRPEKAAEQLAALAGGAPGPAPPGRGQPLGRVQGPHPTAPPVALLFLGPPAAAAPGARRQGGELLGR
uniref:hypothetical protein n=1 Tax=Nocardia carnea TaxID=37328 RepID=UPI003D778241